MWMTPPGINWNYKAHTLRVLWWRLKTKKTCREQAAKVCNNTQSNYVLKAGQNNSRWQHQMSIRNGPKPAKKEPKDVFKDCGVHKSVCLCVFFEPPVLAFPYSTTCLPNKPWKDIRHFSIMQRERRKRYFFNGRNTWGWKKKLGKSTKNALW